MPLLFAPPCDLPKRFELSKTAGNKAARGPSRESVNPKNTETKNDFGSVDFEILFLRISLAVGQAEHFSFSRSYVGVK